MLLPPLTRSSRLRRSWIVGMLVLVAACSSSTTPDEPGPARLAGLPVRLTVKQRTTTEIPGAAGGLRLTIDDVTRGQVMVSLAQASGAVVLAPVSLHAGQTVPFELQGVALLLNLEKLDNALIGDDFGTFVISDPAAGVLTERAKIERLLALVASLQDAVFIRNGSEHTPQEAADHLRSKWEAAGDDITTARQFVEQIATKSSMTGEVYRIRLADGTEVLAGEYLAGRLAEIEAGGA